MRSHTKFIICNGDANFLMENWTEAGSLLDQYTLPACDNFLTLRVNDLYQSGASDVLALEQFFPPHVIEAVITHSSIFGVE